MRAPFNALWRPETATLVPSLFLNATEVETGRRLIVSNLRLRLVCDDERRRSFGAATDAFEGCHKERTEITPAPITEPIRLSTAAGLSARFTYVSPPARLHNKVRVVDGGYYENGGVLTAHDILRELKTASIDPAVRAKLRMVVIRLVNSTFEKTPELGQGGWLAATFHETWAPIAALLKAREARGTHAAVELRAALSDTTVADETANHLHRFGLMPPGCRLTSHHDRSDGLGTGVRTFPLGWMLARTTADEMVFQAKDAVEASLTLGGRWLARYAGPPVVAGSVANGQAQAPTSEAHPANTPEPGLHNVTAAPGDVHQVQDQSQCRRGDTGKPRPGAA